jgi:hypothetical protein
MKKTSGDWEEEIIEFCTIIDPDGWDRSSLTNFYKDWNMPITKKEFVSKLIISTVRADFKKLGEWMREEDT